MVSGECQVTSTDTWLARSPQGQWRVEFSKAVTNGIQDSGVRRQKKEVKRKWKLEIRNHSPNQRIAKWANARAGRHQAALFAAFSNNW